MLHYSLYTTPLFSTSLLMRKGTLIRRAVASLSGGADTRFLALKNPPWYRALASVREIPGTCDKEGEKKSKNNYNFPFSASQAGRSATLNIYPYSKQWRERATTHWWR